MLNKSRAGSAFGPTADRLRTVDRILQLGREANAASVAASVDSNTKTLAAEINDGESRKRSFFSKNFKSK